MSRLLVISPAGARSIGTLADDTASAPRFSETARRQRRRTHPGEDSTMRNKTAITSIAGILIVAGVLGVTATASTAGAAGSRLTLAATTTHEALLTLGTAADPTGNQFVSAHDLFRGARKVGAGGTSCQIIDVVLSGELRVQCLASLSLPEGQLTAQGLPTVDEDATKPFTLAITGGTGAYANARGQVTVRQLDDRHARYTITLRR
jgi:hypothetical protein